MNHWLKALVATLPVCWVGCSFEQNMRRNLIVSPLNTATDQADYHRNGRLAREAFMQMALTFKDQEFSCDYRRGFVDGFTDLLNFGGIGEPPPVPPPSYRFFGHMTPEGLAAAEDWKNGFRHGATTARASNLRDLVTVPVYWGPVYPTIKANQQRSSRPSIEYKKDRPPAPAPEPDEKKPADQPMDPVRPQ